MSPLDTLRAALRALRGNKLRSALTSLGIIIGVASVVVMIAIGAGTQARIAEEIEKLGTNVLTVMPGSASSGGARLGAGTRPTLTDGDAVAVRDEAMGIVTAAPSVLGRVQLATATGNWTSGMLGITEEHFIARDWRLAAGRAIDDVDVSTAAKVVMLGATAAERLFGDDDPIGKSIRADRVPVEVIGLLQSKGHTMDGSDLDDVVMMPLTTARNQFLGRSAAMARSVNVITVKAADENSIAVTIEEVRDVLRFRHRLLPGQPDDFRINNLAETMKIQAESSAAMTQLLAAIASISLLVGGIGIMNIMLVSVTERTREIGIRMAVGARPTSIRAQFLSEATFLSIAGGIAGTIVGFAAAIVADRSFGIRVQITGDPAILAFTFSALVGLVFGLYPAVRASQKSPMEALRYE